jgi:3-oxoacyl-[acyl-carrier protein] reductase
MISLEGKTVVLTGGSRGIGRACGVMMADAGAAVVLGYRQDRKAADRTVDQIRKKGGEAVAVQADVVRANDCRRLVEAAVDAYGAVDILVNNAGIWKGAAVEDMTDAQWQETIDINLLGVFLCCRAAIPVLKRRGSGRIINISSTAGQRGEAFHAHYAATKGALHSFTKSLAVELAPYAVTANCVAPGWTDTDMCEEPFRGDGRDRIEATIPLGRVARPGEIAAAVLFLASPLASYITGEVLNVNGGSVLCG